MDALTAAEREAISILYGSLPQVRLRFCPLTPTARQEAFLLLTGYEVFYGGAAGGGKTVALLMSALQYADVPGYHALIVRRSLAELALPGNLIELSHDWLAISKAVWNGELKQWRFPGRGRSGAGGATLTFGYLADASDLSRYAGSSFSYLGFDELTRFPELLYRRMQRVLRQPTGVQLGEPAPDGTRLSDVPVRVRSASNPGGEHHEWVKRRFVDPASRAPGVIYLPSRLHDNEHLDQQAYRETLALLPPAERERLLNGDWNIPDDGELFKREWFTIIEPHQLPEKTLKVRYWDLAATEPSPANPDPDWTVGLRLELDPKTGLFYVSDLIRVRQAPGAVERLVAAIAERDGRAVTVVIEQEPGSAGKTITTRYKEHVLRGYAVKADRVTGTKEARARPVAAAAENGLLRIVRNQHTTAFLDELCSFPSGHDDCVDALAGAHQHASKMSHGGGRAIAPKGRIPGVGTPNSDLWLGGGDPIDAIAVRLGARVYDTRRGR